jgi:hypothetical protein
MKGALQEAKQVRSGPAGQQRARPARPDSRQVASRDVRGGVANPENPTMNGKKEAAGYPRLDLRLRDAGGQQLVPAYDAMRVGGQPSDFLLDRADLRSHLDH